MTVLVLTRALDSTADLVISELADRDVPVVRMDPGDFPERLGASARISSELPSWAGKLRGQHRDLVLDQVRAVYYRRPSPVRVEAGLSAQAARWATAEAAAGVGGLLASMDCTWVNHPHHNAIAGVAPVALATAVRCGLPIPETLITNDEEEARTFIDSLPGRVAAYKALGSAPPEDIDRRPAALWTTQVHAGEIESSLALTAHLFQEWVPKAYDVRLTVVAGRMFAAEIHTTSDKARIDIRTDYASHTYVPCEVPQELASGVTRLVDEFGLHYAALDFLVTHDGVWYFHDLNPNGQWGFIPELRGPITRALADLLEGRSS
ncbi:ATP-grasp ribosomal peptide maturase [Streptomyces sp. VTCC 41912]|uniref:ATP-grasp ribosomal peptide maturase n=1 Tax=Streptomyces sp. VTCC 41912 TaxID=3383243 RepID=UPI003896DCCB